MTATAQDTLMTRREVAAYLGISTATLEAWATHGTNGLPYIKVGRACRYRLSDIQKWLAERTTTEARAV